MSDETVCCDGCAPVVDDSHAIESYTGTMPPELEEIRNAGFSLIFETGAPVPVTALAERSNLSVPEVESRLSRIEDAGRARQNTSGHLVGIAGLSLEPTRHAVQIEGRDFWTWCALDAVGIFSAMSATGIVRSSPPGRRDSLAIEFDQGETSSAASVFIAGRYDGNDVFQSWCPNVNFFATAEEAHTWAARKGVEGDVVSISEIAETAASIWANVTNGTRLG